MRSFWNTIGVPSVMDKLGTSAEVLTCWWNPSLH